LIGANRLERFILPVTVGATNVEIAGLHRDGIGTPLVFLHGFGSTKEDYADVVQQEQLANRPVLAFDAPGCGATTCSDLTALSIPFLVAVAEQVLRAQKQLAVLPAQAGRRGCRARGNHAQRTLPDVLEPNRDVVPDHRLRPPGRQRPLRDAPGTRS
jgi:Alpha/beta hydrolase family